VLEGTSLTHGEEKRAVLDAKLTRHNNTTRSGLTTNTTIDHDQPAVNALLQALLIVIACGLLFGGIIATY
jgi:hypothetical protein